MTNETVYCTSCEALELELVKLQHENLLLQQTVNIYRSRCIHLQTSITHEFDKLGTMVHRAHEVSPMVKALSVDQLNAWCDKVVGFTEKMNKEFKPTQGGNDLSELWSWLRARHYIVNITTPVHELPAREGDTHVRRDYVGVSSVMITTPQQVPTSIYATGDIENRTVTFCQAFVGIMVAMGHIVLQEHG